MKSITLLLVAATLVLTACSKKHESSAKADASGHHHHVHKAPHGGTLVEVGDHQFNLEFVHDRAAGTLTAYVLDAHAENFVRLTQPAFTVNLILAGGTQPLVLTATANAMTGETVGDTSQFTGTAAALRGLEKFEGIVPELTLRGVKFADLRFAVPAPAHDHDHGHEGGHKHD